MPAPFLFRATHQREIHSKVTFAKLRGLRDCRFQSVMCRGWGKRMCGKKCVNQMAPLYCIWEPLKGARERSRKEVSAWAEFQLKGALCVLFISLFNSTRLCVDPGNKLPCALLFLFPSTLLLNQTLCTVLMGIPFLPGGVQASICLCIQSN